MWYFLNRLLDVSDEKEKKTLLRSMCHPTTEERQVPKRFTWERTVLPMQISHTFQQRAFIKEQVRDLSFFNAIR